MSGHGKIVCVTGASGYIASWLVKLLLSRGYTVRASVRDPSDPKKTAHLRALDGASERLHQFKANLLEEGSFDSGIEGCDGVFHTASPFYHNVTDPQAELIEPAVKGTLNVLKECAKYPSVKRVIVTSSMAAVAFNGRPRAPDVVVDETWFSNAEFCKHSKVADPKKTAHLRALGGASERLHLFKVNLLEEGSFDSGIEGCDGVFHTASPFYHNVTDPQAELIEPAVKGTLNVPKACAKYPSVKRVVVTSSMAAVAYNERPRTPDVVVDETWFSSPEFCKQSKSWYVLSKTLAEEVLSKTLAEEAAWKFAKENGIDMVTINPTMVIGPLLQPTLNTSAAAILNLINGAEEFPNITFGWVNVKDVAMAHILAYEVPSASGRYCLVEKVAHYSEIVEMIRELYPSIPLPEKCADDKPFVPVYQVSKEKTESLGIDYTPTKIGVKETIESLKEKGFVNF